MTERVSNLRPRETPAPAPVEVEPKPDPNGDVPFTPPEAAPIDPRYYRRIES